MVIGIVLSNQNSFFVGEAGTVVVAYIFFEFF